MKPEVFSALLEKYERGNCTPEEKAVVEKWYNSLPHGDDAISEEAGERMWANISARNNLAKGSNVNWLSGIAACIVLFLLAGAALLFYNQQMSPLALGEEKSVPAVPEHTFTKNFANTTANPQKIVLEDGSTIMLEPGSRVSYPSAFEIGSRSVSLSGEAFFNIQRDENRPFYVYTREVVTKVLGTSFTIKAHEKDREITVAVRTGKVHVFTNTGDDEKRSTSVILTPNQQVVYNREEVEIAKKLVEKPEIILEKPTLFEMKYDGVEVTRIFKVLEENYGVDIQFEETTWKDCILTTKMSDEGLIERVQIITKAIGATYSIEDAMITIHGKGCN